MKNASPQELQRAGFQIRPTLGAAVAALAAACDGAASLDGHGFNGYDAPFGHAMAQLGEQAWTPRQRRAIWKMLRKYRVQLLASGIDYAAIPEPPDPASIPISEAPSYKPSPREIRYNAEHDRFEISSPFEPKLVDDARKIPGRRWDARLKVNIVKAALEAVDVLQAFAEKHNLAWTADALERMATFERARQEKRELVELSSAESAEPLEIPRFAEAHRINPKVGVPMPFQHAGARYALRTRRTFIADEQGLGKTIQAFMVLEHEQAYPAIVLCPAAVKLQWAKRIREWLPGRSISVVEGTRPGSDLFDPYGGEIVILNWDIVAAHAKTLARRGGWKAIVADEIHYIGNPRAQRTVAALGLSSGVFTTRVPGQKKPELEHLGEGIEIRLGLSGTPLVNRVADLASQLEFLGRIEDFGGRSKFKSRYAFVDRAEGQKRLLELNGLLRERCYIRRLKKDVLKELPAKRREVFSVEIDNRPDYERAEADVARWCGERAAADKRFLLEIAGLPEEEQKQRKWERATSAEERARRAEALLRFTALKVMAARGKMAQAKAWIRDFTESEKLVVFAWHTDVVEQISAANDNAPMIYGDTSLADRDRAKRRFIDDPSTRLLVCNIKSGGTGVDELQGASSNSLFLELGWNPATHDQAEDRLHRIGQEDSVTAWYMLARGTIEEELVEIIEHKRAVSSATMDGVEVEADAGVLNALTERLLAKYAAGLASES